jgi:DNA-binding LacI/PurR family transcriptional regulator/DNA-binding transcriptional regulator YhcF (GntR family)
MSKIRLLSKVEQIALHLRAEISAGKWTKEIPGREELALDYGLNSKTVEESLRLLEKQGVLIPQGVGRKRKISVESSNAPRTLKIRIVLFDKLDRYDIHQIELMHRLSDAGYDVAQAEKSLHDLDMDVSQLADYVKANPANAWILLAPTSAMLEWFAAHSIPVLSIFGRFADIQVAGIGVKKIPAMQQAMEKLIQLGHKRIVMLVREERRKPKIGILEQAFLDSLASNNVPVGEYNLPDWDDTVADFHRCLDSLFKTTPPTALLVAEFSLFIATQQHLASLGFSAPEHVSIVCDDPHHSFSWCKPAISHISWDHRPISNRALQWANRIATGKEDVRQNYISAEFIVGGTIGPAAHGG